MSDMPATMWVTLALAARGSIVERESGVLAGLAAGAAVITRPALLVAAAVIPLAAHRGASPRSGLAIGVRPDCVGAVDQMAIQNHFFGSPFSTGYGDGGGLFSLVARAGEPRRSSRVMAGMSSARCGSRD